jgi:hypothetical protein
MPRKRKAGRPRKPGPRTKTGRLSEARKKFPELRDKGTPEAQSKRAYLINGSDPQLAASASGILLANGFLSQDQHVACLRYAHAHALVYGKVWSVESPLGWDLPTHGGAAPEEAVIRARNRIDAWNARLDVDQRQAVANVAVFGFIPQFFYTERLRLRPLASDERERQALLEGLDAIAGVAGDRRAA